MENTLAELILKGEVKPGDKVVLEATSEGIGFKKEERLLKQVA